MMHWGTFSLSWIYHHSVFSSGGNPYGTTVTVDENGIMKQDVKSAVFHQAKRTVEVAQWIKTETHKRKKVVLKTTLFIR